MATGGQWSHGLCGCFDDFGLCIISFLVPCVTFGQTSASLGDGSCVTCGLAVMVPILDIVLMVKQRSKIREMKGIQGSGFNDCLSVFCCSVCTLIQQAQEVKGMAPPVTSMSRQ